MNKSVMVILIAVLVILQYRLWFSHDGLPSLLRLHQQVEKQKQENTVLVERNQFLAAEVKDLKDGLEALEERARSELGMIKSGETFFQVIPEADEQ